MTKNQKTDMLSVVHTTSNASVTICKIQLQAYPIWELYCRYLDVSISHPRKKAARRCRNPDSRGKKSGISIVAVLAAQSIVRQFERHLERERDYADLCYPPYSQIHKERDMVMSRILRTFAGSKRQAGSRQMIFPDSPSQNPVQAAKKPPPFAVA